MKAEEMWNLYTKSNNVKNKTYHAWSFGSDPLTANELAKLVVDGVKTATASAYQLYALEKCPLHQWGLNIIYGDNKAVCITETTKIYICPSWKYQRNMFLKKVKNKSYHIGERYIRFSQKNLRNLDLI